MSRNLAVLLGAILGGVLGSTFLSLYIDFSYPYYFRDASVPPYFTGTLFGAPLGILVGTILGAVWPLKRNKA